MAATTPHVPDISETDLERSDLEEAARDLDIDFDDDVDDQTLLERIGVAMGEIDPDGLQDADDTDGDEADEDEDADAPTAEADDDAGEGEDGEGEDDEDAPTAEADDADEAEDDDAPTAEADDADEADEDADDEERSPVHEEGEYRFEEDPREGIEPVLDLEMGPVALDVLGVEVHLRRVHAVLTANPNGRRNVVGKLLAGLVKLIDQGGDEDDAEDGDGSDEGMLEKVTSPVRGLARSVKNTVTKD